MMQPRPYQVEASRALHEYLCTKPGNPCVVIPTGGGKSLMIAWAIHGWKVQHPPFRCVVLAHRKELVMQNYEEFCSIQSHGNYGLTKEIGIFAAGLKRRDYEASILFASIDSVYKRSGEFQPFDVIMVDEAHRIPPRGEGKYLTFLQGCRRFNSKLRVIGWTATPFRMSSGPICHKDHLLNEVCYEAKITDLIRQGYLCNLRSKIGAVAPELSGIKKRYGEYIPSHLAKAVNSNNLVSRTVSEAVRIINAEQRHSVVFFCVDVAHCHAVSQELQRHSVYTPAVTGKTKPEIRERIGEQFKTGQLRGVCNVNVYTEGFNATCVDCIVLLRPTLSPGLFSQMVGRGLRLHANKHDCLVLDFAHCIDEHGPIDCLGNERVVMATCAECRESFSKAIRKCPACGWEIPKQEIERLEAAEGAKRRMHEDKVSNRAILSGEPETYKVNGVLISRHKKRGKPDSLLVRYRCGIRIFREWICLDHEGKAGMIAQQWWQKRFGSQKRLVTINEALGNLFTQSGIQDWTKTITVKKNGKYYEIIDYNRVLNEPDSN